MIGNIFSNIIDVMAITLPADFESRSFSGKGEVDVAFLFTFGLKKMHPCFITSDRFSEKLITFRRKSFHEDLCSFFLPSPSSVLEAEDYVPT